MRSRRYISIQAEVRATAVEFTLDFTRRKSEKICRDFEAG